MSKNKKKKTRAERAQRFISVIILISIVTGVLITLGVSLYNYFS